jgi:hypothetical protein
MKFLRIKSLIILSLFFVLALSCQKDNVEISLKYFSDCHHSQNFDSLAVFNKLIGTWQLESYFCFWSGIAYKADKEVIVSFSSEGKYNVHVDSKLTTTGNWELKKSDTDVFELEMDPTSPYLYGNILYCDQKVMFSNSPVDGCDNLFYRK